MADENAMTDIASMPDVPALSATSDMPVIEETPSAPPPPPEGSDTAAETPPAEDTEGDAGEEGEAPPTEPVKEAQTPPKRSSIRDQLAQERGRAREIAVERDRLASLLEKAMDRLGDAPQPKQPDAPPAPEPTPEPRPKRENFEDPDAHEEALVQWSARRAAKQAAAETVAEFDRKQTEQRQTQERAHQEESAKQAFESDRTRYAERRTAMLADPQYADFAEVAERDDLHIPQVMVAPLLQSESGPDILYYLGKNPQEAERIAKLNDQRAISREFGRIEARLEAAAKPQPSRAPKPIEPVGARSSAAPKDPNEMTTEEYAAQRMPKLQAERRSRMTGTPIQ